MKNTLLIAAACIGMLSFSSCYTDPAPGTGIILVKDSGDFDVPGAHVTLWQEGQLGTGTIIFEGYTDNNGELSYTHRDEQTGLGLEVILDVYAEKMIGSDLKTGQGIIRITPDETTIEEIKIL